MHDDVIDWKSRKVAFYEEPSNGAIQPERREKRRLRRDRLSVWPLRSDAGSATFSAASPSSLLKNRVMRYAASDANPFHQPLSL
ncbi:hypothetical protein [Burkholderia contaminans]|uniref:hypothetical protein n=1 Tax=Burkholderia contaminans TaxID=488447 RepID=UPI001582B318|nr:hypothetical protein [Burkholderia contaminans]